MSPNIVPFRRYLRPPGEITCQRCQRPFRPADHAEIQRVGEHEQATVRCPHCGDELVVARA